MKRKLAVVLAATMTLNSLPITAFAAEEIPVEAVSAAEDYEEEVSFADDFSAAADDFAEEAVYVEVEEPEVVDEEAGEAEEELDGLAEASKTYTIQKASSIKVPDQKWTGDLPDLNSVDALASITVNDNLILYRGTDYTVKSDTADVSTDEKPAKVIFTGIGNYANDTIAGSVTFKIVDPEATTTYAVKVDTSKFVYNGVALTASDSRITEATTVIKNGNEKFTGYEVTCTVKSGDGIKAGSQVELLYKVGSTEIHKETVTIAKKNVSELTVSSAKTYESKYDGKEKKPTATELGVLNTGLAATLATTDYTVTSWKSNTDASTKAIAVITVKDTCENYTGSADVAFTIQAYTGDIGGMVNTAGTAVYTGSALKPDVKVTAYFGTSLGSAEMPSGDYKITYPEAINVGSYNVTIEKADGKANFTGTGTVEKAFTITAANMSDVTVTKLKDVPAGTTNDTLRTNLKDYFSFKLGSVDVATTEFDVSFASTTNEADDEQTLTFTAKKSGSNFTGKTTTSFKYAAGPLASAYTSTYSVEYTGKEIRPSASDLAKKAVTTKKVSTESGVAETLADSDFTVTNVENAVNVGTATALISGKGKYQGQTSKIEFKITAKPVADMTLKVSGIAEGSYFKGQELTGATVSILNGTTVVGTLTSSDCSVAAETIKNLELKEVKVTGKGNYTGYKVVALDPTVKSTAVDIENATVTAEIPAGLADYDISYVKDYVTVTMDGSKLDSSKYTVTYDGVSKPDASKVKVGDSLKLKVTANDPLIGLKRVTATVVQRDIADIVKADGSNITLGTYTTTYDGTEKKPAVTLGAVTNVTALVADTDYTVSYANNINAGEATVTLTGKGKYKGTATKKFAIAKHTVTDITLTETPDESKRQFKVGAPDDLSAELKVKVNEQTDKFVFAKDSDYTIKLDSPKTVTKSGSLPTINYTVTINANSQNYTAASGFKKTVSYSLVKKTVTAADVTIGNNEYKVGDALDVTKLNETVVVDGDKLTKDSDYTLSFEKVVNGTVDSTAPTTVDDVNATYNVVISFTGTYYIGTIRKALAIGASAKFDIKDVKIVVPTKAQLVYSYGDDKYPNVKANYIGALNITTPSDYYTLTIYDKDGEKVTKAEDAGTYKAVVKARANYGGAEGEPVEFTITPQKLDKSDFEAQVKKLSLSTVTYEGTNTKKPTIIGATGLKSGLKYADFEVVESEKEWDGKASNGKAKVALKVGGNYSYEGQGDAEFSWYKATPNAPDLFEIDDVVYNGKPQNPEVKAVEGMDASKDWITKVEYIDDVTNASSHAKAVLTFVVPENEKYKAGTYSTEIEFTIKPASIEKATVDAIADQTYTGEAIRPALSVEDENGILMTEGINYTTVYTNNTEVGTASVEITGIGNYKDSKTVTFNIVKAAEEEPTPTPTPAEDEKGETVIAVPDKKVTYTGKTIESAAAVVEGSSKKVTYTYYSDAACTKEISAPKNAGTYYVKASVAADDKYKAAESEAAKLTITKATQKVVKATTKKTLTGVSKKAKSFKINATSTSGGKITYSKVVSDSKKITVSSSGKVTVKKGLAKGTYKLVVKFKLAGTGNYKARTYNKVITVKVK